MGLIDNGEIRQICINPPMFVRMVVSLHCDNLSAQRLLSQGLPEKLFVDDKQKITALLKNRITTEVMTIPREGVILESLIPYLLNVSPVGANHCNSMAHLIKILKLFRLNNSKLD